jgi:hypothetical protein
MTRGSSQDQMTTIALVSEQVLINLMAFVLLLVDADWLSQSRCRHDLVRISLASVCTIHVIHSPSYGTTAETCRGVKQMRMTFENGNDFGHAHSGSS